MAHVWKSHGKQEIPYAVRDLQARLAEYAGDDFANQFFGQYIFKSELPDYQQLLANLGVELKPLAAGEPSLGGRLRLYDGYAQLTSNATIGSALYEAGIEREDHIVAIAGVRMEDITELNVNKILRQYKPGDDIEISIERWGKPLWKKVTLGENKTMTTRWDENANPKAEARRTEWLSGK